MKIISAIFTLIILISCSEEQIFDISFKENERYYLAGYCDANDKSCTAKVDQYIEECFIESDYDPKILNDVTDTNVDWSNPQEALKSLEKADLTEMSEFKDKLNDCMANRIGGTYAKNMEQGKASWMTETIISRPTHSNFSTNKDSGLLIAIKDNGKIWINKETVELKNIKSTVKDLFDKNPDIYAVIIADRDSSIKDFTSVMDQLKSAGIENISLARTK